MTRKLGDSPLDLLEQRFQALRDQADSLPEASRTGLETALTALSQAIAALRETSPAELGAPAPEAPAGPASQDLPPPPTPPGSQGRLPAGYQPKGAPYSYESILPQIFSAIPDMLTVIDRDFNIVMSNWHGFDVPEDAPTGQPKCYRVFHHRDCPCQDCHIQKVFAGGQPLKEEKVSRFDGRTREFSAFPVLSEPGQVILAAEHVRDVTERRQSEEALKESEATLRTLIEANPESLFLLDTRGVVLAASHVAAQRIGASLAEVIGIDAFAPLPPEVGRKRFEIFQHVVATGQPRRFEDVRGDFHLDISMTPILDQDKVVQVAVLAIDITARKQAEAALQESESRFRAIFAHTPVGISMSDLTGRMVQTNQALQQMLGYSAEELRGMSFQEITHPEDLGKSLQLRGELLAGRIQHYSIEKRYLRKDGKIVWAQVMVALLRDAREEPQYLVATIINRTARHQAKEELRESEQRFRLMAETIQDVFWLAAPDLRQVLYVNPAFEQIWGRRCEELYQAPRTFMEALHPEDRPRVRSDMLAASAQGTTWSHEYRIIKPDGTMCWIQDQGFPVLDDQARVIMFTGMAADITAKKQAEEALRESDKRFRDITEHAVEWVWEVDAQGKYLYSSPVVEQLLGYQPEEVLGKYFYDFFVPDQREKLKNTALAAFAAKQPFREFHNPSLHKDGRIVWLSTSGIPILDEQGILLGYRGAVIDITERREAEALSHNLMANSPIGIYLIQGGKFELVNQWFFSITGYSRDEFLNLKPLELVHPEDREATRENAVRKLKGLSPVPHEYRVITKGGEIKWIMETLASIQYKGRRAVLGYFMDVTERKALELQLIQAQKMEAVGRLAGGVAHDFNNLLMAIMGYGELMRAKVHKGDPLYDHLENILKAGERAAALTHQLLTFSRRQIVNPQVVDLNRVILDLDPMLRRLIGEDLDLEINPDPGPCAVKADPGQLAQIVMNLVVNARDAMPQGGRLTLKTSSVEFKKACNTRFGQVPSGAYVKLVVQDSGVGMDEGSQAHVFEPFFTTKEPGKGTGLGLSTVYGIVTQSEGYLDLDSEPGAGSTFTIYLPRLETSAEPPKAKIPLTASFRGKETILLVEDEDVLRGLLAKFLRLYDYTVIEARHGGEALLTCERLQEPIHLMVTDVVMPQMSGRELADRLTPLRPDMKVLYMSGYTEDAVVQHGVEDLSVAFLQKPFKPIDLARKVYAILHPPEHC